MMLGGPTVFTLGLYFQVVGFRKVQNSYMYVTVTRFHLFSNDIMSNKTK